MNIRSVAAGALAYNKQQVHDLNVCWNTTVCTGLYSNFSERELTFIFAICHRPSVCLSVVCNVRAPYSGD